MRIGNGQGFWGDSVLGPTQLVRQGPIDYLTLDYLAEVTMSIMQKMRSRDPSAGLRDGLHPAPRPVPAGVHRQGCADHRQCRRCQSLVPARSAAADDRTQARTSHGCA